ncbi:MAG: response regulator [Planctomycetota bacterium]
MEPTSNESFAGQCQGTAGREILIVDNDERIVELVAWFLGKRGYHVRKAESFDLARQLLQERPVDLLLSDIDMGAESALEVLPRFHSEGILPPTLVFSGFLNQETQAALMALDPVVGTLAKPVEFQVLETAVSDYFKTQAPVGAVEPQRVLPRPAAMPAQVAPVEASSEWVEILPQER